MKGGGLTELGKEGWGSMEVIKVGKIAPRSMQEKNCLPFRGKNDGQTHQPTNQQIN